MKLVVFRGAWRGGACCAFRCIYVTYSMADANCRKNGDSVSKSGSLTTSSRW